MRRFALLLLLIFPCASFAQESADLAALSLEELLNQKVYSASKYEQRATEAPSSISVITADQIRNYGYRTLEEALQSISGFYVKNHTSYSTLGVRGFAPPGDSNGRVLFLVNGHALNNNVDDSVPIGYDFPIDMDLIDRIEVARGASSSLYGAGAFFGVVNVITRTGKSPGAMITGEGGSLGTYKETAIYGLNKLGTQALFSASYWDAAAPGQLDAIETSYGGTVVPGHIENGLGSPDAHDQNRRAFAMISSHGFTLQGAGSASESRVPSSSQWCGSCHQTDTHSTNFNGYVDLQYEHTVWKGVQFNARTYYDDYAEHRNVNDLRGCSKATCHGSLVDYDVAHGDRGGAEMKLTRRFLGKYRFTAGTEYRDNFKQAQQNYMLDNIPVVQSTFVNYNRSSAIWGIYGEAELRLHPKLILNVGVRNDRYNYLFGNKTDPRAALIYTPRRTTTFKALYGTAYRVPSFAELYYTGMSGQAAPNLQPESISTYEGVWEQQLNKRLTLNATGFYNHIGSYIQEQTVVVQGKDTITAEVGGIDQTTFSNSKATAKGAELELVGKLPAGAEGRLSYTYEDARNEITGAPLPDAPRNLVKLDIATPLYRRMVTPTFEAEYMSRSSTQWPEAGYSSPPVVVNMSVTSRQLWGGFSLSGGAYNLVGRSLSDPRQFGYIEQTGLAAGPNVIPSTSLLPDDRRTFRLKLTWNSKERGSKDQPNTHSAGDAYASK